jgi:hypothetical protein
MRGEDGRTVNLCTKGLYAPGADAASRVDPGEHAAPAQSDKANCSTPSFLHPVVVLMYELAAIQHKVWWLSLTEDDLTK